VAGFCQSHIASVVSAEVCRRLANYALLPRLGLPFRQPVEFRLLKLPRFAVNMMRMLWALSLSL
jgi:hypothetical protein